MKSLRICVVTETYPPDINGCAKTVGKLVDGLRRRGHEVQLARLREHRHERRHRHRSYEILPLPGLPIPFYRVQRFGLPVGHYLEGIWDRNPPDVIYVATEGPLGYSAVAAAQRLHLPVVSGFHTRFDSYSTHYGLGLLRPVAERYLRTFHQRSACTVVPTEELSRKLQEERFGQVEVVGRGINTSRFSPTKRSRQLRRSWGATPDDLVVTYVGRVADEKNIRLAARAYRNMREARPDAKFVLVGDGPLREDLEEENPDFLFCGWRRGEDLARHYASGDVFLFPSTTETFGNVTLEAMASGLAVVTFDYAAARMYVEHDRNGLLADFNDEDQFVERAVQLAQRRDLVRCFGENARHAALGTNWEQVCDSFEQILCQHAQRREDHGRLPACAAVAMDV
jgi:glycosyltransferase involved in cell wall biosynthesis